MGMSSDAIICFGIALEEEQEYPWDEYEEIEEWWLHEVLGYKHPFEIYDSEGNYIDGIRPDEATMKKYYNAESAVYNKSPLPIELVTHCSYEYPMYIVALPGTKLRAYRGDPKRVEMRRVPEEEKRILTDFCDRHEIEYSGKPCWWLASLFG